MPRPYIGMSFFFFFFFQSYSTLLSGRTRYPRRRACVIISSILWLGVIHTRFYIATDSHMHILHALLLQCFTANPLIYTVYTNILHSKAKVVHRIRVASTHAHAHAHIYFQENLLTFWILPTFARLSSRYTPDARRRVSWLVYARASWCSE